MKLTNEDLEAGKSAKGGYTREKLAEWGVPWPPPTGWKEKLLRGEEVVLLDPQRKMEPSEIYPELTCQEVLHRVTMASISNGHSSDIHDMPEVLAYFGSQIPDRPKAEIDYTNWRGVRSIRIIKPLRIEYTSNEWHPEEQFLLHAIDAETGEMRSFAMNSIHSWRNL